MAAPAARVKIILTKANGVQQQACFLQGPPPELIILFRHNKFANVDPNERNRTMAGRESKRGGRFSSEANTSDSRWQKAIVIHEMGHMMHAFNDNDKYQSAVINHMAAAGAPPNLQPEYYKIADVNQRILNALAAKNYKGKWAYAQDNPAEVVAEVWTALMHDRNVPLGLAAVYLAYGGMRTTEIDRKLSRLFPGQQIPAFNQPEDALNYI